MTRVNTLFARLDTLDSFSAIFISAIIVVNFYWLLDARYVLSKSIL